MAKLDYLQCTTNSRQKILTLKEKRSKFVLNNPNEVSLGIIKVDGCLVNGMHPRCDYIVEVLDERHAYYVELKGCELDKAIKQLSATLELTQARFKHHQKTACVVTTRVPKQDNRMLKIRKDLQAKYHTQLTVKNNQLIVDC